ncbi:MAG: ABC transporter ATP-binding protein [Candidatus Alcyoniella australis]|nr:ABC transporter ATP-binding protein [Candidatus Alcyoniella australis]
MIRAVNLRKQYSSVVAVKDLNLTIEKGEVFGFLGPNGAGKTTTIKIMAGLLRPTSGQVTINGFDIARDPTPAKAITGFIPDRPYVYGKLTGMEFLQFIAGLYRIDEREWRPRAVELLKLFELRDWAGELVESYSHGMKQRLVMSVALLHRPKVLIVDEPMVGLDPKGARLVKRIFRRLADDGLAVFMSTHTLEVAEEVCDRVGIIHKGELIESGTLEQLRQRAGGPERLEAIFLDLTGADEDEIGGEPPPLKF